MKLVISIDLNHKLFEGKQINEIQRCLDSIGEEIDIYNTLKVGMKGSENSKTRAEFCTWEVIEG